MRLLHHPILLSTMLWILFPTNLKFLIVVYVKIQRNQPCISKYISDPTLYLFQILNLRNCVLYVEIAATKIFSSIERFGGFKIDSDKTKLAPS